ncbi:metalloregulator ArsR/SmtB family transcription factor [Thiothrix winogradskyi]|uniref:metalloregulator ArsR/SmtB family transcription factor n=1 Tax=Thiothrix winogradskyi TaxID=96472 RepID=UPI002882E5D7|nr:metalloregulator ArsR/SmtB family transcription factor [Thiothrix winogradskyi]
MLLEDFTKSLSDQTRLRILLLLVDGSERCVCELTQALELAQPKISRHLAVLRESGLLQDRKAGLWVYYRLHPELPTWAVQALACLQTGASHETLYQTDRQHLAVSERQNTSCQP